MLLLLYLTFLLSILHPIHPLYSPRYYRAPELLVNNQQYTGAVDVWSIGLIFLELVKGDIVLRGENYVDQLRRTCEVGITRRLAAAG